MLRSMYAGISGMRGFQTKLDVIGDNIANVNTSGFKKGRATFQDMMSQMVSGAQGSTTTTGGVNPSQVGLGSQLGSIDNTHTQGFRQETENSLDFAIEGDGMFVVRDGNFQAYTRSGNFYLDDNGQIVNPNGLYLMGYSSDSSEGRHIQSDDIEIILDANENAQEVVLINDQGNKESVEVIGTTERDDNIVVELENGSEVTISTIEEDGELTTMVTIDNEDEIPAEEESITLFDVDDDGGLTTLTIPEYAESFSVGSNGIVTFVDENGDLQEVGQVALANFSNPEGLAGNGSNLFIESANSGTPVVGLPNSEGVGSIVSGSLEMSNVDLAEEFSEMITAQRGFQANTKIITTSDEILQELVNLKR